MRGLALFLLASLALPLLVRSRGGKASAGDDKYLGFIYTNDRVTVVTRVHGASASSLAEPSAVISFLRSCESYATTVIVCIGVGETLENAQYLGDLKKAIANEGVDKVLQIVLLPVTPWGKFTPALNAAVSKVAEKGDCFIAFQSLEFRVSASVVTELKNYMAKDSTLLVVGPRMSGHDFFSSSAGDIPLRGRTTPWNTFAIWRTRYLALTGFPLVADGMGGNMGGVEEVTAISLLQSIAPDLKAVLANVKGVSWETNFSDPKRRQWHEEKMKSKDERPGKQIHWLGIAPGKVCHVEF